MLFAIEPGNNTEDFCLFLNVIKNYLVDNYWLNNEGFVRLPMDQSDLLHGNVRPYSGKLPVEIGTIDIIHDDKMVAINKAFVRFIEELENRVISYSDFMQYRSAIMKTGCSAWNNIFQKVN